MTLQFRPPFQIDPNAPSPEMQSLDRLNQSLANISQSADARAQQSRDQRYKDLLMQLAQAKEAREAQAAQSDLLKNQTEYGTPAPAPYDWTGGMAPTSAPAPQFGPQPNPAASPASTPAGGLVAQFRRWEAQRRAGQPAQGAPEAGFFPRPGGEYQPVMPAGLSSLGITPDQATAMGFGGYSRLGSKQLETARLFSEEKRKQDELDMKKKWGPGQGKGVWKLNQFTGTYDWYPNSGPGGFQNPGGTTPPSPGMTPPAGGFGGAPSAHPVDTSVPVIPGETFQMRAKRAEEKPKASGSLENTLREYDNMINEVEAIKKDKGLEAATGASSFLGRVPGTSARTARARIETLKAKTLLNVLQSLKDLSNTGASGFGQLSNIEGENLRNSISTLDVGLQTPAFIQSLDRFVTEMKNRKEVLRNTFVNTYGNLPSGNGGGGGQAQFQYTATGADGSQVGWDGQKWVPIP